MGAFFAALVLSVALGPVQAQTTPLPSRTLPILLFPLPPDALINFDVYDARAELLDAGKVSEVAPHSIFRLKQHVGVAAGYDNGVLHGSVGFYITVAEWGRMSFGTASPEIGFGRYHVLDQRANESFTRTQSTILISLASVHIRGGYLRSINKMWYFNLEQIFDSHANVTGSQFGISFSKP